MRAPAPPLAAVAASLLLASCGGGDGAGPVPPQGPPAARHPASDLAAAQTGEEMRAQLLVATKLYGNGRYGFAAAHLGTARRQYATITAAVRRRNPALDREFHAAFGVIAGEIAQRAPAAAVANRIGLVQGQLLDAAIPGSMSKAAFRDPGVTAQVMSRLAARGELAYAAAARDGYSDRGRREYQDAFGLIARAASVARRMGASLGPQGGRITGGLGDARNDGFATGVLVPRRLRPVAVAADVRRAQAAISERFGFAT